MSLNSLRKKINGIDEKLVALLGDRAALSIKIGKIKQQANKSIYSPSREKEVLARVKAINKGPVPDEALEAIYREIMSTSLSIENISGVAYLGQEGSFSSIASRKIFGSQVKYISCSSIPEVFQKVEFDDCSYGVVPIENSVEGAVTHTFDLFVDSELKICRQLLLPIAHNLIARQGTKMESIKKVYSKYEVFGQCRNWLLSHLPNATWSFVDSTTEAARLTTKEKNTAAIASSEAANAYHLETLRRNIQDVAHNTTRFLVIAKQDSPATGKDRTSILFSIKDKVGALHAMLTPFYRNKINLSKIESRPSKKKAWDYYFFVDIEGHRLDKRVKKALSQLEGMCKYLKILGSYPIVE